jgi:hypothetical protein
MTHPAITRLYTAAKTGQPKAYVGSPMMREDLRVLAYLLRNPDTFGQNPPHPDDIAVDAFAEAMKAKMAKQRAKGYGGWNDKTDCTPEYLQSALVAHVAKGDPVDVGNFAMMLFNREEKTVLGHRTAAQQEPIPPEGSLRAEQFIDAMLKEYGYPANPKNAARAGYRAARLSVPQPAQQEPSYRCVPYSSVPGAKVSEPVDYYTHPPVQPEVLAVEPVHQFRKKHWDKWMDGDCDDSHGGPYERRTLYTAPQPAQQERNFCERCGKRLGGGIHIHTCTPPQEALNVQG